MADNQLPVNPGDSGAADQGFDLREALNFAWRQWKFIATITVMILVIGGVYLQHETPLYTATSQILLDSQKPKMPGGDSLVANTYSDADTMIENQIAILRSTVFLRRVVERARLVPEVPAVAEKPVSSPAAVSMFAQAQNLVLGLFGSGSSAAGQPAALPATKATGGDSIPPAVMSAVGSLKAGLKVTRAAQVGNVIAISVTSPDPVKAANLADAIADAYLVDKLDTRFDAAKRASTWLSDRLVGLRNQLRESEEVVARFRAEHGLLQSGGTTLNQQQLSELNAKLIDARADLAQKKARVDLLNSLQTKGSGLQNMPDISNAGALPTLRQQESNMSAQEADLLARYGASHPLVVNIRAQLRDIDRSIGGETARLAASLRNEHELAQARVSSLEKSLQQATGQTNIDDATAVSLRELERTAAVNKTLFEDFLQQSKITQEQSTFEPQEARIISPASTPANPSYPQKTRFIAVNLLIGLLVGVGGAFAKEKLHAGFTTSRQAEDVLGLPLLTSISRLTSADLVVDGTAVLISELPIKRPLSKFSEAIRSLRSGIHMTDVDHPPRIIQVTSAVPNEGKTTIGLSIAASAANAALKVLFIDGDLRHPTASRLFEAQKAPGLVDLLVGDADLAQVVRFYANGGYWTIAAGSRTQNPTDLLASEKMKTIVAQLRDQYDLIVIDTPPAGPVIDPVVVSTLVDKAVIVVRWGVTARELVGQSVDQLSGHRKIAGVVFNLVNERQAQKFGKYAYSYYYSMRRQYSNYYK